MTSTDTPIPAHLTVVAWPDPIVEALGFPPDHPYSELVWTSTLGPSAVLAWRQLARTLLANADGFTLDVAHLAHSLGLGGSGAHATVRRTLRRLAVFGMASFIDECTYAVRRCIPPLSSSQLRRLNPQLSRFTTAPSWSAPLALGYSAFLGALVGALGAFVALVVALVDVLVDVLVGLIRPSSRAHE